MKKEYGSPFMDADEAAAYLRVAKSTLYQWAHKKEIPYRKHGDRIVFLRSQIQDWSNARAVEVAPRFNVFGGGKKERASIRKLRSLKTRHTTKIKSDPFLEGEEWNGDNSATY